MSQAADHLSGAQIEEYVTQSPDKAANGQREGVEAHLADCESCLGRVLEAHRVHLGLLEGDGMNKTRYPGCPEETTLQEVAAGISPAETAEETAQHAAHCDSCGPLLNRYVKEFSDDLDAEDAALARELETSRPGWQKKFVRQNVILQQPRRSFWPRLVPIGALAAIAVAIVLWQRQPDDLRRAEKLVASAYGERRTTEMRLPGAPHGRFYPPSVVKGGSDEPDWHSESPDLSNAKMLVKNKSSAGNLNPEWLQIQGEIDLLDGGQKGIEQAIESFEKALAENPNNPELKVNLAAALFEKEMRADADHPVLARTIELLTDVLKNSTQASDQVRAAALFNLALAYEKSEIRDLAVSAWEQYLQLDKKSEWRKEAQQHLDDLRNHAPPPRQQGYNQPAYFLSHSSDPDVLANLEEFQDTALRTWLAAAIENPLSESGRATTELARLLREHHSDTWLEDLMRNIKPDAASAIKTLSRAVTYDLNDLHYEAIRESQNAAGLFREQHNSAGELRARYQEVYGLQRSLAADDCIERINKLWPRVFATSYRWLQGQLALEKAACSNLNVDFTAASLNVNISRRIAARFQFPELLLRVAGFEAGIQQLQENYDAAWTEAIRGLRFYWSGPCVANETHAPNSSASHPCSYSWERLYQFYSVMQQCARKMRFHHASESLLLQEISILERSAPDDVNLKATLYLQLANILSRQGDIDLADQKAAKAESLLREVSSHEATAQLYAAVIRIELAEFELKKGDANSALSKIEPLRGLLSSQDDFVRFDFYTTEGETFRQLGEYENAIRSYTSAIKVAETSLAESQDDPSQLSWRFGTGKAYRGLTRSLLKLGRDRDALAVWERFQSQSLVDLPPRGAHRLNPGGAPWDEPLPPVAQPHLIYASFQDGLEVWLTSGSKIEGRWIPLQQQDLERQLREFAKECGDPSSGLDVARQLYTEIIEPIITTLPSSTPISVELDEPMWGTAIEALRGSNGHYLADDHPVTYTPGLLAEKSLRQPTSPATQEPMLLIDASQALAAPLPGHTEEVTAVKQTFANTITLGPGTISPNEIRQKLARSWEFHFSGHGKRDGTGTALMIGSDSSLKAKDFTPERLRHMQLVVLSACSSASARNGAFDESSLVRSFLAGGVPAVVASRWDVDSRSTAHFMQNFYTQLSKGEPASEALQYAQSEMRAANQHPYYWAAFSLTGRVN